MNYRGEGSKSDSKYYTNSREGSREVKKIDTTLRRHADRFFGSKERFAHTQVDKGIGVPDNLAFASRMQEMRHSATALSKPENIRNAPREAVKYVEAVAYASLDMSQGHIADRMKDRDERDDVEVPTYSSDGVEFFERGCAILFPDELKQPFHMVNVPGQIDRAYNILKQVHPHFGASAELINQFDRKIHNDDTSWHEQQIHVLDSAITSVSQGLAELAEGEYDEDDEEFVPPTEQTKKEMVVVLRIVYELKNIRQGLEEMNSEQREYKSSSEQVLDSGSADHVREKIEGL